MKTGDIELSEQEFKEGWVRLSVYDRLLKKYTRLKEMLEEAPVAYLYFVTMEGHEEFSAMSVPDNHHTHSARLVEIEELLKEDHEV
jgi:hypothetical protein